MSEQIAVTAPSSLFTAAIAQNAGLNFNIPMAAALAGYGNARSVLKSIVLLSEENLDYDIFLWGKAAHGSTYDTDTWLGWWRFVAADGVSYTGDLNTPIYRYWIPDLDIVYQDLDAQTQNPPPGSLHGTLIPRGAAKTINSKVVITFFMAPEVPWSAA